jgi:hypothetical protein
MQATQLFEIDKSSGTQAATLVRLKSRPKKKSKPATTSIPGQALPLPLTETTPCVSNLVPIAADRNESGAQGNAERLGGLFTTELLPIARVGANTPPIAEGVPSNSGAAIRGQIDEGEALPAG